MLTTVTLLPDDDRAFWTRVSERPPRIELPDPVQVKFFRRMNPPHRVAAALHMTGLVRSIVTSKVRSLHPDWSEEQISLGVAERYHARRG